MLARSAGIHPAMPQAFAVADGETISFAAKKHAKQVDARRLNMTSMRPP